MALTHESPVEFPPDVEVRTGNLESSVRAGVADIIAATERLTGRAVAVEHRPAFASEARELRADTTKIRVALGWTPKRVRLDELIADQCAAR